MNWQGEWLHTFDWALQKALGDSEARYLDPPAEVRPLNQSPECYEGEHANCPWDLPGACHCECHSLTA